MGRPPREPGAGGEGPSAKAQGAATSGSRHLPPVGGSELTLGVRLVGISAFAAQWLIEAPALHNQV